MSLEEIWEKSLSLIEKKVGVNLFELWFKPIKLVQLKEQNASMEIPNRFYKEWIEDYYPNLMSDALGGVVGHPVTIKFKIAEKVDAELKKMDARLEGRKQRLANKGIHLNPKYTFENFITGPSNQFAHAAAVAVADSPGMSYNPLFVYGGVGLGKTHLITAIGNIIADKRREFNILYVSAEQFTNEVVAAVRHGKTEELKGKYRNLDLLLIDDIQFIENKNATQEELFHTINTLYERQKQIVLSSDRPPKEIKAITDRLRSRFSMGLIADIQPPELELRMAIIQKKAEIEKIKLTENVVAFLATKIKTNIRELEGCLIRLGAHTSLTGSPIDVDMARDVLKDIISDDERPVTVENILKVVSEFYGIKCQEMKSKKRTREIALPRQVAMYLSKQCTDASLNDIGKNFGGKDHATVIYACKQMEEKRAKDEDFDRKVQGLINRIKT
ncbi:MAG TPA: chromosomal replication initiator protein DnaA [Nitrospiraceae bacterium]|jgi:chromosomal replication initiator protein|nr:chromosomal replication initiator protein DnaA [Nitrospiraceae bacterium]